MVAGGWRQSVKSCVLHTRIQKRTVLYVVTYYRQVSFCCPFTHNGGLVVNTQLQSHCAVTLLRPSLPVEGALLRCNLRVATRLWSTRNVLYMITVPVADYCIQSKGQPQLITHISPSTHRGYHDAPAAAVITRAGSGAHLPTRRYLTCSNQSGAPPNTRPLLVSPGDKKAAVTQSILGGFAAVNSNKRRKLKLGSSQH